MPKRRDEHKVANVRTVIQKMTEGWELSSLYAFYCRCQRTLGLLSNVADPRDRLRCVKQVQGRLEALVKDYAGLEAALIAKDAATRIVDASWDFGAIRVEHIQDAGLKVILPVMEALEHCASKLGKPGLEKAELWLKGIAKDSDLFRNAEAVVYLLSRGKCDSTLQETIEAMRHQWRKESDNWDRLIRKGLLTTAPDRDDAANMLEIDREARGHESEEIPPRFWDYYAEFYMDATMLRTAEWAEIQDYESWWSRLNGYLSSEAGRHGTQNEFQACQLFSLCRSELALKVLPGGLGALARAVCRGKQNPTRPWEIRLKHPDRPLKDRVKERKKRGQFKLLRSDAIASAVAFCGCQAKEIGFSEQVVRAAERHSLERQKASGAWTGIGKYLDEFESVLRTAMAVHALLAGKPKGWAKAAEKGAKWLWKKQDGFGRWAADGVDAPFLTVLVLDAIAMANGETWSTIKSSTMIEVKSHSQTNETDSQEGRPAGTDALQIAPDGSAIASPSKAIGVAMDVNELAENLATRLNVLQAQGSKTKDPTKGHRGPHNIEGDKALYRMAVLAAWKKVKESGDNVFREKFCEHHTEYIRTWRDAHPDYQCPKLTVKRLENFQAWEDQRHRRANAKQA